MVVVSSIIIHQKLQIKLSKDELARLPKSHCRLSEDSRKVMKFNVDDDIFSDGVYPLDNIFSEKCTTKSPLIFGLSAFDSLNKSESKYIRSPSRINDFQNNTDILQKYFSSSRRVNLEDTFKAEDSLKTETVVQEINRSSIHSIEVTTIYKNKLLNNTYTEKVPDDNQNKDVSGYTLTCNHNFDSHLNINNEINSSINTITKIDQVSVECLDSSIQKLNNTLNYNNVNEALIINDDFFK